MSYWASGGYQTSLMGRRANGLVHYILYEPNGLILKNILCSNNTFIFNCYLPLQVDMVNKSGTNLKSSNVPGAKHVGRQLKGTNLGAPT
jgi:hypothetical protein